MPRRRTYVIAFALVGALAGAVPGAAAISAAGERDASAVELLRHEWRPDAVWERIGKTKFIWSATVRNTSAVRQRVFVYYDLLDERGAPLARNVANQFIDPDQTATITADSYILSVDLPRVTGSRAVIKIGFPN